MGEKIELLSLDIFNIHWREIEFVKRLKECLNKEIGWHYLLDLAWMMKEISTLKQGSLIMDAGGGNGLAQFMLSEQGYNVINADFSNPVPSKRVTDRYGKIMFHLNNPADVTYDNRYTRHLHSAHSIPIELMESAALGSYPGNKEEVISYIDKERCRLQYHLPPSPKGALPFFLKNNVSEKCGKIFLYKCDFRDMSLLPDNLLDGIVSISALEHNDHEDFEKCVEELLRVTRPGGKLVITVSASQKDDWFHEASKGWCYSERTLKKMFQLEENVQSNFSKKDELFEKLCEEGNELHKRLASFHYKSSANGMPWGVWKPQYMPVGIVKIKQGKEDLKEKIHVSEKGESLQKINAFNLNREGEELFLKGDMDNALNAFKKAVEANPEYETAFNNLGVLYWHTGEVEKAVEHLTSALRVNPNRRDTILNCTEILKNNKDFETARKLYLSYLQTNPDDKEMLHLYRDMENKINISSLSGKSADFVNNVLSTSNELLAEYKDRHKGQRCVIIGNGPSLNQMDLSFLKSEITFGLNRIYLLFDKWDFRPTYYVSVNPLVIEQNRKEILNIQATKFVSLNGLPYLSEAGDTIFLRSIGDPSFSRDPRNGLWEGYTVTYVAMQLAYFMGFSEVVLIGVDHCFTTPGDPNQEVVSDGNDLNHFHPEYFGKGVRWNLPDLRNSEIAYDLAKQAFESDGRSIIDATVEGKLDIFTKADYKELFLKNQEVTRH